LLTAERDNVKHSCANAVSYPVNRCSWIM